jgi:hypothetical protein
MFVSEFNNLTLPAAPDEEDIKIKILNDLFCEETYKKKIIKCIFNKDENKFKESVNIVLSKGSWHEAASLIEELFNKHKVNYFSEEAVKFVDILQSHFARESFQPEHSRTG